MVASTNESITVYMSSIFLPTKKPARHIISPWKVGGHDSGSSAAATYAKHKADIAVKSQMQSASEVEKKVADLQERGMEEVASTGVSTADELESEVEDKDLEFSSFVPSSSAALPSASTRKAPKGPKLSVGGPKETDPKRRRMDCWDALGRMVPPAPGAASSAAAPAVVGKPEATASKDKIDKVANLFEVKKSSFIDDALWEGKIRQRAFEQLSRQLEEGANKVIADPQGEDLAREMLDFPESALKKFQVFQKLKKNPQSAVNTLEDAELKVMENISPALLSRIFIHIGVALLKNFEEGFG